MVRSCFRQVQRAFDEAQDQEERLALASELRGHIWEALRCPFANYVLQKCVMVLSRENLNFIFQELKQKGPEMIQQAARHKCDRPDLTVDEVYHLDT